jgi:hypothetical protein
MSTPSVLYSYNIRSLSYTHIRALSLSPAHSLSRARALSLSLSLCLSLSLSTLPRTTVIGRKHNEAVVVEASPLHRTGEVTNHGIHYAHHGLSVGVV